MRGDGKSSTVNFFIDFFLFFWNDLPEGLRLFMEKGGNVLWPIAVLTLFMWMLIIERIMYYRKSLGDDVTAAVQIWEARAEHKSWYAMQIRQSLISQVNERIDRFLPMIRTMVALCPLLGLMGTVTGMIEVFHIMAVTGGGDAKAMAGGVSHATIPTMAGMVAALSGLFANTWITRAAVRERESFENRLILT